MPNRNTHYDAVKNVPNWKDINPRVSVAYDLFGNGKTALKASASRGVEQNSIATRRRTTRQRRSERRRQRAWNDVNTGNWGMPGDCVHSAT